MLKTEFNKNITETKTKKKMKSVTVARSSIEKFSNGESASTQLRTEGDSLFENGKLFEALECYNKSLSVAQLNSPDSSLAYERRSCVYFRAKEYQLCLDNIDLSHRFCEDNVRIESLDERKKMCEELMGYAQCSVDADPSTFFKLSYRKNDKIPFIVDCLEMRDSEEFGRFIITNQGQN